MRKRKQRKLNQAFVEAARDADREARKKRAETRAWRRLARQFPRREPEGVALAYDFYSHLTNEHRRESFTPRLVFKLDGEHRSKERYREAVLSLMRALNIKHMRKSVWGSDNPEFYLEGLAEIGGTEYEVWLMFGHVVPKGCKVVAGEHRRTWSTTSGGARAYCGVRT